MRIHHLYEAAELFWLDVQKSRRGREVMEVENVGDNKPLLNNPCEEYFGCEGRAWSTAIQRMLQKEQSRVSDIPGCPCFVQIYNSLQSRGWPGHCPGLFAHLRHFADNDSARVHIFVEAAVWRGSVPKHTPIPPQPQCGSLYLELCSLSFGCRWVCSSI